MRSYVINLDRSPDRLDKMQAQFAMHGACMERVRAVDGLKYEGRYLKKSFCMLGKRQLSTSEIACFLSHRLCWKIIASGSDSHAAVFEDDMVLSDKAWGLIKNGADWLNNTDLLKIETYNERLYFQRKSQRVSDVFKLRRMLSFHAGAGGYIISKKTAALLLTLTDDSLPCPVDHYLFNNECFPTISKKIYQLVPAISIQSRRRDNAPAEDSTIQSELAEQVDAPRVKKTLSIRVYKCAQSTWRFLFYKKMKIPI